MKKLLPDFDLGELTAEFADMGLPKFRALQVSKWIGEGTDFWDMKNLPLVLREMLTANYEARAAEIDKTFVSADGTVKFLARLSDGNLIESVLMKNNYGYTVCASTQVGCRMGCVFCASGRDGLVRNLSGGEILGQIIAANGIIKSSGESARVKNIVLMGSGEPMDNYVGLTRFICLVRQYLNIGQRNISVSTCGFPERIRQLADEDYSLTLCISLHATTDWARQQLMPIAKRYAIAEIISAARYYFVKTGRRVIFEYALMSGKNMTRADAIELRRLTSDFPSHINLIPLNNTGGELKGCTRAEAEVFCRTLTALGASATVRRTLGSDVSASCGQLRAKHVEVDE